MYADIINPRAFPEQLAHPDYDPLHLMPAAFPDHPRVFLTGDQLLRARHHIHTCDWARRAFARLTAAVDAPENLPGALPAPKADAALNNRLIDLVFRLALAFHLTGKPLYRERALRAFRLFARTYDRWPLTGLDNRAGGGALAESRLLLNTARAYDLLAAADLANPDHALFRNLLEAMLLNAAGGGHRSCGNINTWSLAARLAAGAALGSRPHVHDTLYGGGAPWRYGLIHQFRHDILSDGLHWEQTPGYHFYTLMAVTEALTVLDHLGVDAWHARLPAQLQHDGDDRHRAYGPRGLKCIQAAFDTPFYLTFPNGDMPLLHDSGLANIRGVHTWGVLYNKAWEAYADPKYAWLLHRMEAEHPDAARTWPGLPMPLQTHSGDVDFARLRDPAYPAGEFHPETDAALSLTGRHTRHCTLFPVSGSLLLRSRADRPSAVGASLFFGPHWAGHMDPAALHLDLWARGRRRTDAPRTAGYDDPLYLTWKRTTASHNTVTVDETPMFPYDFDTASIWECDHWRDSPSDGALEQFQPDQVWKMARASNVAVYPGVRLDRTVIVGPDFALDVFRCTAETVRRFDWILHGIGALDLGGPVQPIPPSDRRGYTHLKNPVELLEPGPAPAVRWSDSCGSMTAALRPPDGARIVGAGDPVANDPREALGELDPPEPRNSLLIRADGAEALFLALFTFDGAPGRLRRIRGAARTDLVLETMTGRNRARWKLPVRADQPVLRLSHKTG